MNDAGMLEELAPHAEALFERHCETAREWFPHEFVPWDRGRDFTPGEQWAPEQCPLPSAVRSALFVNLLTEDNLPYYFHTIDNHFSGSEVFKAWDRRWTAEENRHAITLRDYLTVTRALDPVQLERARMAQMCSAVVPEPESVADTLVYVALQELATRISHRNTGKVLEDKAGADIMVRIAADENLHYLFYRDLVSAALDAAPSETMLAIERQVRDFAMPGVGIVDFSSHAAAIARLGVYDFAIHHEQILVGVVLRRWKIDTLTGLDAEAEAARGRVISHIDRVGRIARRFVERRSDMLAAAAG